MENQDITKDLPLKLTDEIKSILKFHKCLNLYDNGKIRCSLTGHEMPCKIDSLLQYINGKKFQKISHFSNYDFDQYREHLEPISRSRQKNIVLCKLTLRQINNTPDDIFKHVEGKRFKKAFLRWKLCQENNEEFKPVSKPNFKNGKVDVSDDDESDKDLLSDLYPAGDFEDIAIDKMSMDGPVFTSSIKRKTSEDESSPKRRKRLKRDC